MGATDWVSESLRFLAGRTIGWYVGSRIIEFSDYYPLLIS